MCPARQGCGLESRPQQPNASKHMGEKNLTRTPTAPLSTHQLRLQCTQVPLGPVRDVATVMTHSHPTVCADTQGRAQVFLSTHQLRLQCTQVPMGSVREVATDMTHDRHTHNDPTKLHKGAKHTRARVVVCHTHRLGGGVKGQGGGLCQVPLLGGGHPAQRHAVHRHEALEGNVRGGGRVRQVPITVEVRQACIFDG